MAHKLPPHRMASTATLTTLALEGADGRHWYRDAIRPLALAAMTLGCTPERLCAAMAITSPRVQVKRNVDITLDYIRTGSLPSGVMVGTRSAMAHWEDTGEIRGPKTGPFCAALLGDQSAVVLDVWMAAALGIDQKAFDRKATHEKATQRVRDVAAALGWTPAEAQAAIWTAIVRRNGRNAPSIAEHLDAAAA